MPNGLLNLALGVAMQVGTPGPSETPGLPAPQNAYGRYGSEGSMEPRYPFDTQQNFVHGYFQEIPAYGGHHLFRPYNYKDVLAQSQTAAGWGERPTMPYSQQFWHKYHDQATMLKTTQAAPLRGTPVWTPPASRPIQNFAGWSVAPGSQIVAPAFMRTENQQQTGWTVAPGSQIVIPQPATPYSSGPLHVPAQNLTPAGYPYGEIPQGEIINPVGYRR